VTRETRQFKRVVVYRIGSLGDTLVVLPAFHLVRQAFPDAHITLLTNFPVTAKAAPMETVLRNTNLYNDTLKYPVSLRDSRELFRLRNALQEGNYDCLVYLASPKGGVFTSLRDYVFFKSCSIPTIIGVPFSRSTLRSLPVPGTDLFQSRTNRALEALKSLGTVDINDPKWWDLKLTPDEIAEADSLLGRHGITPPFLAASVGTKIQAKDWEEHNWRNLIERAAAAFPELPLVLLGVDEERERSERLLKIWNGPKANLCGETSPRVAAAILRGAGVMVCHDSGPMHVAATMGVPCVAIFSARAKPGEWFPRGENHAVFYRKIPCWDCGLEECFEKRKACILSITVDEVFDALVEKLAHRGIRPRYGRPVPARVERFGCVPADELGRLPVAHVAQTLGRLGTTKDRGRAGSAESKLSVLLVGNYPPDRQESMQRFSAVMERELNAAGIEATVIRPEPFFGRLKPGASGLGKWLGYLDKFVVFPRRLKRRMRELQAIGSRTLVVHICDHSNSFYVRYLRRVPHVVTCHDLLAVRSALGEFPQNPTRWSGRVLQRMILGGLEKAQRIVCASNATLRDVCRLMPIAGDCSSVVKMGLNNPFAPVPIAAARARVFELMRGAGHSPAPGARYMLHVGGAPWYKNRAGVIEMFCELRRAYDSDNLHLVFAGEPLGADLKSYVRDDEMARSVVELTGVSHDDLCALYSAAELLIFPSLHEGFGWPIVEAQACGCPVVTTGWPPMNEVGGTAAVYLDPANLWSAVDILVNVLDVDEERRRAIIQRGYENAAQYSTQAMTDSYGEIYVSVAKRQAEIAELPRKA